MSKTFGIRFQGLEEPLEAILKEHIKNKDEYVYFEIGVASMVTHRAIRDIIQENIKVNEWATIGLDVLGSLDVNFNKINEIFKSDELFVNDKPIDIPENFGDGNLHSVLVLRPNPREWIKNVDDNALDLVFCDGCHGKACVIADFLAVENKIKSGGYFMAHDCGLEESGTDWQGHCGENINVRNALIELNLLDKTTRPGWEFVVELAGTRKTNKDENGGNSLVIFKKL